AGRVLNLYGPSEDTTYSCYAMIAEGSETAPIGKPIANTQAYVLNEQLKLVPKGAVGELYLGGSGLARGYINRPDLTAERFIPNPFATDGARLYRTGDLVRHLQDGQLEFLDRADHQVKIRGFRVELGEIETVLRSHPGVQDAVAIAREDTPGDLRLVAYIVPQEGYQHSVADLRRHLQERLPVHMVPGAFVLLEALPLTPNGKLNRAALPAPEATSSKTYIQPETEIEKNLAGIWADLLKLERVSINDDFFELGGHSLLAARLTSRIWQQFDVELSLRTVFTTPTISGLAALIESSGNGSSAPQIIRVEVGSDSDRVQNISQTIRSAAPARVLLRPAGDYTAPRTPIEETLADIWAELLSLDRVSVHDDFFEAGGHSLLAARLASRIRHTFGVEISLKSVFESPTIASQAQLITASPQVEPETLPNVTDEASFPLSYSQQRLWFLQSLEPDSPAYNLPGAIRLTGQLQPEVLKRSLNEIVRRHEVLRTRFVIVDGEPRQFIDPWRQLDIQLIDLSPFSTEECDAELKRLMSEEARLPFDLTTCPLMRAKLVRLSHDEHVLLLTLHHIVADGWSLGVMAREVGALYSALVEQQESQLPESPVQYVDFAVWQQKWLTTEKLQSHLDYWKTQLANSPSFLDLPTDRPRPQIQTFRGATHTFEIPEDLSRKLTDLSRSEGVTSFITLLTAFKVLLYQYTRQADLLVGTPIANRTRLEIEGLIGCFVNTLVLRTDLSGNPDFRELLKRVRKATLEAFEHQDLPFEKLVEELQPERRLSHSPLFQVMFVLQDAPAQALELPGLKLESIEVDSGTAKYDLTLSISQMPNSGLVARLEYSTDLFDEGTAVRLLTQYENILETVVHNSAAPINDLPLLRTEERQRILFDWNDTSVERSGHQFIHRLFETQAAAQPDAIALVFEGHALTYAELNRRANQLANHLRKLGLGPETFVGICVERSFEMVWGLLGILKAGAAYVPIDPAYPAERLSYMLEDSGVSLLLTQNELAVASSLQVLVLDSFDHESTENPTCNLTGDNAAYAIYTSGSTGRPKAAINTHAAIANRLLWMQDAYQLTTGDCVLQKTPFSFDVSVWEFFWPLLAGARLVLARPGGHLDSSYLIDLIVDEKVTTIHFVPSMLQMFLEDPAVGQCESLRRIICSGEALSSSLMLRCFDTLGVELHNLYGPTEAAVDVTSWKCDPASLTLPIGRPISNTQIYILNPELQPVPVGVHGELHIGGVSLARGYLNRPALTAEKFIPDPFTTKPGARLYKTGDSCRYLADGNIEFIERLDHQVKMRGFRIELGEIESALRQHPMVREAVVTVREDQSDQKRLVAYVVTDGEPDVREFLKKRLPDYMVPSALVVLEKMPLTSSGKIDRKALPSLDGELLATPESYTPPRTGTEQSLADIWARVLGLERVGVTDNFFAVGGDSILSMRVVIEARKCGIEFKPKD
ncbi:MAG TPA: amino acid adenylation domain-containing protein, partial [Pyrinomonadaceae bacterium]|nr:amino acid adenylation domain-containing protein [Pyrinomonadaceae bacterium]